MFLFNLVVACMSVNIANARGNALQIKPEQKEIGYLNKKMKSDMEEITMVITPENPHSVPGMSTIILELIKDCVKALTGCFFYGFDLRQKSYVPAIVTVNTIAQ